MGGLSHTVSGDIASFRTPSRIPIESLKFHFLPKQAAGTPMPENPIPIEGWTGLNGYMSGYNVLPFDSVIPENYTAELDGVTATYSNGIIHMTGNHNKAGWSNVVFFYTVWSNNPIILPAGTYTVSNGLAVVCAIDGAAYANQGGTFTVTNRALVQGFYAAVRGEGPVDIYLPLTLTVGTKRPKKYMPYCPINIIPITFPNGEIIYGGYYDPVAGEIVAEYGKHIYDGTTMRIGMNYKVSDRFYGIKGVSDCQYGSNGHIVSNMLKTQVNHGENVCYQRPSEPGYLMDFGRSTICDLSLEEYDALTIQEQTDLVNSYLAELYENGTPLIVIYKLIEPIHIQIPVQDFKAFLDYNNFWSNANDITEVTYPVIESKDILEARKRISSYNIGDYVTNGLVLWMDGIDKGNLSNAWVDKVNGTVFTANNNPIFASNCIELDGTNQIFTGLGIPVISCDTGTIEVIAEMTTGNKGIIYMSKDTGLSFGARNGYVNSDEIIWSSGNDDTARQKMIPINGSMGNYKAFSVNKNIAIIDGVEKVFESEKNYWGHDGEYTYCFIGGRNRESDPRYFNGKIYAIRLYNRQLTKEEMLHNQMVDNRRFNLHLGIS